MDTVYMYIAKLSLSLSLSLWLWESPRRPSRCPPWAASASPPDSICSATELLRVGEC